MQQKISGGLVRGTQREINYTEKMYEQKIGVLTI